jgi:actin-like ATPase involved in cell morphogenesis
VGYTLGVDLGTTFLAAATAVDGRAEMFTLGDRSEVVPSAVYLREDGTLLTGDAATGLRTAGSTSRVAREFKRRLGDPTPVVLAGRSFAATELLGAQLRDVLAKVTESEGAPPDQVVLTHPANWGPFRRTLFDGVLPFGGLDSALKVTEPEAAAARYAATRKLAEGALVAVYDLGGGTFDATILRKTADGMEIVGIPEGIERLGGIDFDEAILRHVNYTSENALNGLDMRDPRTATALARLRQDAVLAKEALSADTETALPVFLPDQHFEVTLTRETFEGLIRAHVESTIGALARTLDSAQVRPEQLTSVLLIGGSSRIPLIARMLSEAMGRPIAIDTHPKYAVALGAAAIASQPSASAAAMLSTATANGSNGSSRPASRTAPPSPPKPPTATPSAPPAAPPSPPKPPTPAPFPTKPPTAAPPAPKPPSATPSPPKALPAAAASATRPPGPASPPRPPQPPSPPATALSPARPLAGPPARAVPPLPDPQPAYRPRPPDARQPTYPAYRQGGDPSAQRWPTTPPRPAPDTAGRGKQRGLVTIIVLALLVAGGVAAWVLLRPSTPSAQLVLSSSAVKIGDSYTIRATGFTVGELVEITWTGPTQGSMGAAPADASGARTQGPILERDPVGQYLIVATGRRSGRSVQAPLTVLPER